MSTLTATIFPDTSATRLTARSYTVDELEQRVRGAQEFPAKESCPLIKLARFGDLKTDEGCLRHDANVLEVHGIEGDYDGELVSLGEAQQMLASHGVDALFYTSARHSADKPRWRVLCALSRPYPPAERARFVARLNGALGGILAPESYTLSQAYYIGRVNGSTYSVARVRGQHIDLLTDLDAIAVPGPKAGERRQERQEKIRGTDPVIHRLADRGLVLRQRTDGGVDIVCPFESEHTTARAPGDCTYWPAHTGGFAVGHFKCLHSHCARRPDADFLRALGLAQRNANGTQAEAPDKPKATPLDLRELARQSPPKRSWALAWWISMRVPTLLVGGGGAGKTLLMLQLGACFALARRFIDEIPQALRVLMWCCEDDHDELWRRMVAIARWIGADLDDFADRFIIVPRIGMDNTLFTTEFGRPMWTPAFEEFRQQAGDYGAHVLMLDNSAQLFGGNENDRHQVTTFINGMMGSHLERAVIIASHPSRQAGSEFSGSSAWENACRCRLYLGRNLPDREKPEDEESNDAVRYLARRKINYGVRDWRGLTFNNDGVLVPDELEIGGGMMDSLRKKKAGRVVLDAARRLQQIGTRMTDGSTSPQFLPRLVLEHKLNEGCTKRELAEAMRRAMLDGDLTRGEVGHYSNRAPMHGLIVKA